MVIPSNTQPASQPPALDQSFLEILQRALQKVDILLLVNISSCVMCAEMWY